MKHSDFTYRAAKWLIWIFPALLIVPNVALSVSSGMSWSAFTANVALPLGAYMLLMSMSANVGRTTVLMLPFAILAAFQIVLIGLYEDGSVIAVDMFLNVVTTNSAEVSELLGNLAGPVALVIVLYLPVLTAGVVAWCRHRRVDRSERRPAMRIGSALAGTGLMMMIVSHAILPGYKADYQIFPVNALCNLAEAVNRTVRTNSYAEKSAGFTYDALSLRPGEKEVYIAVVGETSRADHYQLLGYDRFTTPRLCTVDSLLAYGKVLSESNTTHKSVPMLLSAVKAENYGDSIYSTKSVITAFREAGFNTVYLSMQGRNGSFIDFFGNEADSTVFMREDPEVASGERMIYDDALLPAVDSLLSDNVADKLLIVLHLYGSHFNYGDRYPRSEAYFLPDKTTDANVRNREQLVNAYDNSLRMTDNLLYGLICRLDSLGIPAGMIYTADHGEDIFDDERGRFLHASPTATIHQLHVPLLLYFNRDWRLRHPRQFRAAASATGSDISSSESFTPTLLHMAGIDTPRLHEPSALTSPKFESVKERRFLNDRNESVNLHAAGFQSADFATLSAL